MAHKKALEALNRTQKDLEEMNSSSVAHSFYCLVIFDKLYQLYHDQHPLMSFMHV
jgi:hypothetical protein